MACTTSSFASILAVLWALGVLAAPPLTVCIFLDPSSANAPRWLVRTTVGLIALVALGTVAYGVLWFQAPAPSQWTAVK